MEENIETVPLSSAAIRQYINAKQVFSALRSAEVEARSFRGSMLWREVKGHTYLIRTSPKATQTSLGRKNAETEAIYEKFMKGKTSVEERRDGLAKALVMNQRMNKALFVGRVDDKIVDILNGLRDAGLGENFTVVGTNALYAYEAAAGVRIESGYLATNDLDLLWDNRRKLTIAVPGALADGMIGLLRQIDKTFAIRKDQLYTAVNKDGYEVDILRRMGQGSENDPAQVTQHEDDFWAVKARNADWLLSAPKFREIVVGTNGRMAEMITVDPRAFVLFKVWMAGQKDRDPQKRTRDANQARVVVDIIHEHLPQLSFDDIHVFPSNIREMITDSARDAPQSPDSAKDAVLQEMLRSLDGKSLSLIDKPTNAALIGPILEVNDFYFLQSVGRGKVFIHEIDALRLDDEERKALVLGADCEVTYGRDGGPLASIGSHDRSRGRER